MPKRRNFTVAELMKFFFCACDNPNKKIDTPAPNADKKQTHTLSSHPPLIKYLEIAATPHASKAPPNDGILRR